ncbi:MAG: 50S ribosomal protein L18 [Actinobacteria bacterium]|nr:50S ribosomal protein L18 [Actinomycetota bacterium]MCL5446589.1 50S ribosomal protein L18 [Actinomycetota bacterium]
MSTSIAARRRQLRFRRHAGVRKKVSGTIARPRLVVFRSARHISAQIVDDVEGQTLASASTVEKDLRSTYGGNIAAAEEIGRKVAARAKDAGVTEVVFDRGGFRYHGRVAALGDAARQAGLKF